MKRAAVVAALMLIALVAKAYAWEATYIAQAVDKAIAEAKDTEKATKYGPSPDSWCLAGGFVAKGEAFNFAHALKKDKQYAVVAAGDNDVEELRLDVMDKDGKKIADGMTSDKPYEFFNTSETALPVKCKVTLTKCKEAQSFVVLLLLEDLDGKKGGRFEDLRAAAKGLNTAIAKHKDENAQFLQGTNTICFVGTYLEKGAGRNLWHSFTKGTQVTAVGSGDDNSTDVDIIVSDREGEKTELARDTDQDNFPVATFTAGDATLKAQIRLELADSKKAAFCVMGLLVPKE